MKGMEEGNFLTVEVVANRCYWQIERCEKTRGSIVIAKGDMEKRRT